MIINNCKEMKEKEKALDMGYGFVIIKPIISPRSRFAPGPRFYFYDR
jgi:hypothetical protein